MSAASWIAYAIVMYAAAMLVGIGLVNNHKAKIAKRRHRHAEAARRYRRASFLLTAGSALSVSALVIVGVS